MITLLLAAILSETLTGKVVGVIDGDTIEILVGREPSPAMVRIRLAEIDAPEQGQAFGQRSKQALSEKIFGKIVEAEVTDIDRYERKVAIIRESQENVCYWMVEKGWAWQYRQYSKSKQLAAIEATARKERRGLWADANPIPPREWRKSEREKRRRTQPAS